MEYLIILNPLGILLNFMAGFLLAPELIGIERLDKFEKWLEIKAPSNLKRISSLGGVISYDPDPLDDIQVTVSNMILSVFRDIVFYIIPFWFYIYLIIKREISIGTFHIAGLTVILTAILLHLYLFFFSLWITVNQPTEKFGFLIYLLLAPGIVGVILSFANLIIAPVQISLRITLKILQGDKRLPSILTGIGIVFFIIGNILQFIATYE